MPGPRILFTVLNWGMGHASRSIPVIRLLLRHQCDVIIGSDGDALALLQQTFPAQQCIGLSPYDVRYPARSIVINGILNARNILSAIERERKQVAEIVNTNGIDLIISDNRYGCFHPDLTSILITHQLRLVTTNPVTSWLGRKALRKWLRPFNELWIPDTSDHLLSGDLSASEDTRIRCIGLLSTMIALRRQMKYSVAVVLSGPEPQRSALERSLVAQLQLIPREYKAAVVRGLSTPQDKLLVGFAEVFDFMGRHEMQDLLNETEIIICRPGYSSLMDLLVSGRKALLIPTPGQPEQEYLARRVRDLPQFVVQDQNKMNLSEGVQQLLARQEQIDIVNPQKALLEAHLVRLLSGDSY